MEILGYTIFATLLLLSFVISYFVFAPVVEVSEAFLTSLLTVDSLSIAVVGFIFPLAIRTLRVEDARRQLKASEEKLLEILEEIRPDVKSLYARAAVIVFLRLLSFGLAAVLLITPIIFVSPFVLSILFSLIAMLRTGDEALKYSFYAFTSTVFGYLLIVAIVIFLVWLLWQSKMGYLNATE